MIGKISVCVFIKDNNLGAFGLWESMATLMPIADEYFVMDMGSTDGTWEILTDLASKNKKIRLERSEFPINPENGLVDAGSFAVIPNQMIPLAKNDLVIYYQADEIWHQDLMKLMIEWIKKKDFNGLAFWRYQLGYNFQKIKWHPHPVHRIDYKDQFNFTVDGMNTDRVNDVPICSTYDGGWFTRWGAEFSKGRKLAVDENGNEHIYGDKWREITEGKYPWEMPTNEMIMDISSLGGFRDNVIHKTRLHAPYWRVDPSAINIGGRFHNGGVWYKGELNNPDWTKQNTPFNIPEIMRPWLGIVRYSARPDLLDKIVKG